MFRAATPKKLLETSMWWHGSQFLENHISNVPNFTNKIVLDGFSEVNSKSFLVTKQDSYFIQDVFESFSSFSKLTRVVAYSLRFIDRTRKRKAPDCATI